MRLRTLGWAVLLGCAGWMTGVSARAEIHGDALRDDPEVKEAYRYFYDLDYTNCIALFEKVQASHPGSPDATTFLLEARVFQELYRQDLLDTTFYANDGFLTGKHPTPEDPAVRDRIFGLEEQVEREAGTRLSKNPRDVDALYARGWARSLKAAYMAMVERGFSACFHLALAAHSDEVKVLQIDPEYEDAKLVAGTYQYVIGALPWGFKFLFGFAGHYGLEVAWAGDVAGRLRAWADDFGGGRDGAGAVSAAGVEISGSHYGGSQPGGQVSARLSFPS